MLYLITTTKDYEIVSLCTRNGITFDSIIYWDCRVSAREILSIDSEGKVVVAICSEDAATLVKTELIKKSPSENLIDFFKIYRANIPFMVVKRVITNPLYDGFKGIILGLSHAEVGIISENLKYPTVNLAVSSQDLFYNLLSLKYAFDNYPQKFADLKYLIIDMYKYNYFNFDTSLSRIAVDHCIKGGYNLHPHNFSQNKNFSFSYDEMVYYALSSCGYADVTKEAVSRWNELFYMNDDSIDLDTFSNFPEISERSRIIPDADIESYNYSPNNVLKHFDKTIKENIGYFKTIIQLAKEFNPDIKIYVLQMPMYEKSWKKAEPYYISWKKEFEEIILDTAKEYDLKYLDWTTHPMSTSRNYWFDGEHLNYLGALVFTELINDLLDSSL